MKGFTLMELLIAIAIVGILAAIAIPSYLTYVRKSQYTEIIQTGDTYKTSVAACIQRLNTVTGCNSGTNGIPTWAGAAGNVSTVAVTNGVIVVTPTATVFAATDTYTLTPTLTNGAVVWAQTCANAGYC
jgi:type IV pilus assembly protein PilA